MEQAETISFLSSCSAFASDEPVEVIQTHGAFIFLCGDTALKLKRAVRYDYMDLSTVERRRALIARELELNRPSAPEIYRDMLPVTRSDAGLALDGGGQVVDWVLRMWRFATEDELGHVAERGALDDRLARQVGRAVAAYHAVAPVRDLPGRALIADILEELNRVFAGFPDAGGTARLDDWRALATARLDLCGALLDARSRAGHVRRAHGDLHLRNLVLIDGRPVLYDALEFDERLGTCDVLYDVAFLVMDLCHRNLRRPACRVLDAWLRAARGAEDAGLAALPLFLSVRAAIRAMVLLQTDAARGRPGRSMDEVENYLETACTAAQPPPPQLIAIGGFSGSGKSVLANALAPRVGPLPGAVLLSSDLERKTGVSENERLAPVNYGRARRESVYRVMLGRAATLLGAGQSVVLDATFLDPRLRAMAADVAARAGVPFRGFWLNVCETVLAARLRSRRGDASDADVEVLNRQLSIGHGDLNWIRLDGAGDPGSVSALAERLLAPMPADHDAQLQAAGTAHHPPRA